MKCHRNLIAHLMLNGKKPSSLGANKTLIGCKKQELVMQSFTQKKANGYLSTWSYFKVTDGRFETSSNKDSVTIVFLVIGLVFREQLFWKTT